MAFAGSAAIGIGNRGAEADPPAGPPQPGSVRIQLLGLNDLHGHLEPPEPDRGGVAWLAANLDRAEADHPGRTIRVHAGDMLGASPLVSSWFQEEPTIKALNLMRFDVGTLGNHEFDEGGTELLRLVHGGRRADGLDLRGTSDAAYEGAAYPYVAANAVDADGQLVLPPVVVAERAGVKVGFIGVTTTTAPGFLLDRHKRGYRFLDASDAVNRWVGELRSRGVEAIVVLAHSGNGEILSEAAQMDDAVDVVIAGHTHNGMNRRVGSKLVLQARPYGVAFDRVVMDVDRLSGEVTAARGSIEENPHTEVEPDAAVAALVDEHATRVAPVAKRVVGRAPRDYGRGGGVIALAAEAQRRLAGADMSIVHRSTVRAEIDAGEVTYEELFRVGAYEHDVLVFEPDEPDALARRARDAGFLVAGSGRRVAMTELTRDLLGLEGGRAAGTEVDALVRYAESEWR